MYKNSFEDCDITNSLCKYNSKLAHVILTLLTVFVANALLTGDKSLPHFDITGALGAEKLSSTEKEV